MNKKFTLSLFLLFFSSGLFALGLNNEAVEKKSDISYKTNFGKCPNRSAGAFTLKIVRSFEQTKSLLKTKYEIVEHKYQEKYFISQYRISYNPLKKVLNITLNCPSPLLKVQIYKNKQLDFYDAILVDTGDLYDPTFEVLLKNEEKLSSPLPLLALPLGKLDSSTQQKITDLAKSFGEELKSTISEIIYNDDQEVTLITSNKGRPSSIFLGTFPWEEKIDKLKRMLDYLQDQNRIPTIVNLTNPKKVVVKFNDTAPTIKK